ncbi:YciI-like protein [Cesiribacter sp. SM1]|uniref:YciI-like protein n=1 Tax=Cesiribacter sp. SM1 TaxID=2861196 RepID=UPI001CD4C619|nr:YciI-like protein [Cesiribacter sp. SM1]
MYFILFYKTVENYVEKRAPYRNEHLALAKSAYENGDMVMAGALAEPADGAVLVFRGDSPAVAEQFALNDPYVKNGLIKEWSIRPWSVVVGGE